MKHRHAMRKLGRTSAHRWALLRFVVGIFFVLGFGFCVCFVALALVSMWAGRFGRRWHLHGCLGAGTWCRSWCSMSASKQPCPRS